ncbi:MAG: DUF2059 domain-containing protein [Opitutaceae bacterium]
MRILPVLCLGLVLSSSTFAAETATASDTPPQLRGLLSTEGERLFSLVAPGGLAPKWVKLGATFDGWELADFKPADETLTLKKGAKTVMIKMEGSAIGSAASPAAKATLAQAEEVIRKMDFDRMMSKMMDQQKDAMVNMTRQMGQGATTGADREAVAAFQKKTMDTLFEAMDFGQMKNDMAQVYSETFTADELRGLSDFYSTPSGLAMIEKQPEVAQKINGLMMSRMMTAMPKIQAMSKEFAAEQAAKRAAAGGSAPAPAPK